MFYRRFKYCFSIYRIQFASSVIAPVVFFLSHGFFLIPFSCAAATQPNPKDPKTLKTRQAPSTTRQQQHSPPLTSPLPPPVAAKPEGKRILQVQGFSELILPLKSSF